MNWDAIGAIGQLVGAIAVVITLGYLALQIRHAKEATADVSRLDRGAGIRDLLSRMAEDGLRDAWIKAEGTENAYARIADALGLTLEQAAKIEFNCQGWFWLHWAHWASTKTDRDVDELRHIISKFYSAQPMSTVWALSPHVQLLAPEFVHFVDSAIERGRNGQALHEG